MNHLLAVIVETTVFGQTIAAVTENAYVGLDLLVPVPNFALLVSAFKLDPLARIAWSRFAANERGG